MAEQVWHWLSHSGTILTATTILFFTGKGLLWLLLPGLVVRHAQKRMRQIAEDK